MSDAPPSGDFKRLRRSSRDKVLAGVCGGIGEYFGVDPVLVRLAFLIAVLCFGTGFLVYVVAIFLMPSDVAG